MPKSTLYLCLVAELCLRACASAAAPAPVPVPVGDKWFGDDGNWSPVDIRVGNPQQWLSVFPNTASQETWVIGPGGCDDTDTCQEERGGIFYKGQSTTWTEIGYYELGFDTQLGDTGNADYGLDNVDLSDEVLVSGQIVGIINTTEFWLGSLGLGVQPSRFQGTTNRPTFLSSLVENNSVIPSHSYGYTAGSYYRLKNVPASLTLGGVDTNRFVPNDATFLLGSNQQPIVAVNSIKLLSIAGTSSSADLNWTTNSLDLQSTSQAELYTIDSSTPFLWLPGEVCDSFAEAFNLVYNDTLQLYFYPDNDTTLGVIQNQNITFTFAIADLPGSSNSVDISLPFAAFDLQLSFPYPGLDANVTSAPTNYFPLRRAANSNQYTIGRAFLQEAYLAVDYERSNFSISQATFALDSLTNINLIPITRPANSNYTGPAGEDQGSPGLSVASKAGIGIAIAVLVASIAAVVVYFLVFRKRSNSKSQNSVNDSFGKVPELPGDIEHSGSRTTGAVEVLGDRRHPTEMISDSSNTRYEMSGAGTEAFEMAAGEVPLTYYQAAGCRNDPGNRAELENTDSEIKAPGGPSTHQSSPPAPPAYTQSNNGERLSDSISPNSARHSCGALGTASVSSGEQGISPVGHGSEGNRVADGIGNQLLSAVLPRKSMNFSKPMSLAHYKIRGTESSTALLAPQPQDEQPSRSLSGSSRFMEDLTDNGADSVADLHKRASSDHKRFSWEE